MNVLTRILVSFSFITGASIANAGTESDWSGPAEPKREVASESLEDTLRSWDRADYTSNMTEAERVEREVIEAEGPVKPARHYSQKKATKATKLTHLTQLNSKNVVAKKFVARKAAKKSPKRMKTLTKTHARSVALNASKKLRR